MDSLETGVRTIVAVHQTAVENVAGYAQIAVLEIQE